MKFLKFAVFSTLLAYAHFSFAAHEEVASFPAVRKLALFEMIRDKAETQNLERAGFENITKNIGEILGEKDGPTFSLDKEESFAQVLFSFIRSRHYYSDVPNLVSLHFFQYDQSKLSDPDFLERMQVLFLVDKLVFHSILDKRFEEKWKNSFEFMAQDEALIDTLKQDVYTYGENLTNTTNTAEGLIEKHKLFFHRAFEMHSIFAPMINLETVRREFVYFNPALSKNVSISDWNGWKLQGGEELIDWPGKDFFEEIVDGKAVELKEGRKSFFSTVDRYSQKSYFLPLIDRGFSLEKGSNSITAEYMFKPFFGQEFPTVMKFSMTRIIPEWIKPFVFKDVSVAMLETAFLSRDLFFSAVSLAHQGRENPLEEELLIKLSTLRYVYPYYFTASNLFGRETAEEGRRVNKILGDSGNLDALYAYAVACFQGIGGDKNLIEARRCFKIGAEQGHVDSRDKYAGMCENSFGGVLNYEEARKHYKEMAKQGLNWGQYSYASMCHKGEGGDQNLEEARTYYKLAADEDNVDAQYVYAAMCEKGEGGPQALEEARKYYKVSADQGNEDAQYAYAIMCDQGHGGEEDLAEAKKYYELAANQGNHQARLSLAFMLGNGEGGVADLQEAFKHYEILANHDKPIGFVGCGDIFLQLGQRGKALRSYQRAGDLGKEKAKVLYKDMKRMVNQAAKKAEEDGRAGEKHPRDDDDSSDIDPPTDPLSEPKEGNV
ncbi:MAG: tetratricopeptide repeat protein [Alphaproteobacteria bacterium]